MDLYGIVIWSEDGFVILDEKSMVQSWGNTMIDNIDGSHPVLLRFKFPTNAKELRDFRLSITYDMFRTYSGADGVGNLSTTSSGSGHSHSLGSTTTGVASGSMSYNTSSHNTGSTSGHTHSYTDWVSDRSFEENHTHTTWTTIFTSVEGSHSHVIQNHTHPLLWGIYTEGYSSLTVDIYVNGDLYLMSVAPGDAENISIPEEWFNFPGWNDIEIYSSEGNSRVNATYYTQVYIET